MITIQEIAELAGVSRGTVDRVINHRGKVNAEVEKKVLEIIDKYEYKQKQRKKNYTIGVVTQLQNASFMEEINKGIQQAKLDFQERGISLNVRYSNDVDEVKQLNLINQLEKEGIDALALMPVDHEIIAYKINELTESGIPVVTFNSDIVGTKRLCYVGMDNYQSGKAAANLLALLTQEQGDILVITGYFTNRANSLRVESFVHEIQKYTNIHLLGVQCSFDKPEVVEEIITNTYKNTTKIAGIFLASAGQTGVHNAMMKLHEKQRPYVVAYDVTKDNIACLKRGDFDFLIDQESHLQSYRAIQILYNVLQKKQYPSKEEEFTNIHLKTKDIVD